MNEFQFNNLTIRYTDSEFTAFDGDMVFYSAVPLSEEAWNEEHEAILKEIKSRLKAQRTLETKKFNERIDSLGDDIGRRYYSFQLDNRLYHAMKAQGLNMTKFINLAIAEKLNNDK